MHRERQPERPQRRGLRRCRVCVRVRRRALRTRVRLRNRALPLLPDGGGYWLLLFLLFAAA